jgi:hypothetical protein
MATETARKLWDPVSVEPDRLHRACFGALEVWVRHSRQDWYVAFQRLREEKPPSLLRPAAPGQKVPSLDWERWVTGGEQGALQFLPAMPDRSVVVRPQFALNVPQGRDVLFFTNIPLWVRVTVGGAPDREVLCEIPAVVLSNTWFGDPAAGELCYALKTKALRDLGELSDHPYMATCPVHVTNQAPTSLEFQRICVRVEHLHVYRGASRLWTNQVEVTFKGEQLSGQINILSYAPPYEPGASRICAAREPVDRSLLKKSFSFLRTLTGF